MAERHKVASEKEAAVAAGSPGADGFPFQELDPASGTAQERGAGETDDAPSDDEHPLGFHRPIFPLNRTGRRG